MCIRGAVQGVGFRPNVYRIATEMGLKGWVNNTVQGVLIEAEGSKSTLEEFKRRVIHDKPPLAVIQGSESSFLDPVGFDVFEVQESEGSGEKSTLVLPDVATCPDCLKEVFDPKDRRYLYPFTNCTNCGPRFSIIETLPYDRERTSMKAFPMCSSCREEYEDPSNRRFHAQPNACPDCGPQLAFWNAEGTSLAKKHEGLMLAVDELKKGHVLAVKGLGGFHLMVDARSSDAISRLRTRKHREEKPLAVMFPNIQSLESSLSVSSIEKGLLEGPECPIVLLSKKDNMEISEKVSPQNPTVGAFLPYTPLHHILLQEFGFPVVATSANHTDEPICTDEQEALKRLSEIADAYLIHDRPIVRYVDDSIARVMAKRPMLLRRARGYAPLPVQEIESDHEVLALGAHLKNTISFSRKGNVFLSHHLGDLENSKAIAAFQNTVESLPSLYDQKISHVVCDLHPDYFSSQYATKLNLPIQRIQHHYAHVRSCMTDNDLQSPVLGVAWDGTGLGTDRTIWGSEFLTVNEGGWKRVGHIRSFSLPGGDASARKPNRVAMGLLNEILGKEAFVRKSRSLESMDAQNLGMLSSMFEKQLQCVPTTSMGRLFDAVASLIGLRQSCSFEGQAAMELEFAASKADEKECPTYSLDLRESPDSEGALILDWETLVKRILEDAAQGVEIGAMAQGFHKALVEGIVSVAKHQGMEKVLLTGGCFQNKFLTEHAILRLKESGFQPYWHQRIPPNDGGISVGQLMAGIEEE